MPDYSQGKIYRIYSPTHLEAGQYIGSTTQPLSVRMAEHRRSSKEYEEGRKSFYTSFVILQYDDAMIELIEEYACENKEQLNRKEGEVMRCAENCVNKAIAGRTNAEYRADHREELIAKDRAYYEAHRDERLAYNKAYHEAHRDDIIAKKKAYSKEYYAEHREELNAKRKARREAKKSSSH